ncbi:uncharacterized protein LOC131251648 [Magnolia sinica]|uniref:uncharacterized protein LOC131251648 n=1 Tax=Magnolia sinica TaxID=86752 RepID=UPI00265B3CBB|nr:uncharacterized protein LOC131251648 [Magnolia sinica]
MVLGGFSASLADILIKGALFILVQALVYLILSNSSNVFSTQMRSFSFKRARSVSIRRMLAALSDLPPGGEPSPSSSTSLNQQSTCDDSLKN